VVAIVVLTPGTKPAAADRGKPKTGQKIAALADAPAAAVWDQIFVECEQASEAMVGDQDPRDRDSSPAAVLVPSSGWRQGASWTKPEGACWCSSSTSTT